MDMAGLEKSTAGAGLDLFCSRKIDVDWMRLASHVRETRAGCLVWFGSFTSFSAFLEKTVRCEWIL